MPVILETFTFLERTANRDVALLWKDSLADTGHFEILECSARDVEASWSFFDRRDLHKLSAVDATSFVLMRRARIRKAFTFDQHFAAVGFELIG